MDILSPNPPHQVAHRLIRRMHIVLKITSGHYEGTKVSVRVGQSLTFGRTYSSDVTLPTDPMLSSRHFLVENQFPQCHIRDCNSTNGTFVNSERVTEAILREGDVVQAGSTHFRVTFDASMNESTPVARRSEQDARNDALLSSHKRSNDQPAGPHAENPPPSPRSPSARPASVHPASALFHFNRLHANETSDDPRMVSKTIPILPRNVAPRLDPIERPTPQAAASVLQIDNRTNFSVSTLLWENRRMEGRLTVIDPFQSR